MAKKRFNIGSVVKGDPKTGKKDYISLNPKVTILFDGVPVKTKFINLNDPIKHPDELLKLGLISAEIADKMKEEAAAKPFIRFNLQASAEG